MRTPELLATLERGDFSVSFVYSVKDNKAKLLHLRKANLYRKQKKSIRSFSHSYKKWVNMKCSDSGKVYRVYVPLILKINGKTYIY